MQTTTIDKLSVPKLVEALGSDFGIKFKSAMINGLLKDYCHTIGKKWQRVFYFKNSFYSNKTKQPIQNTQQMQQINCQRRTFVVLVN